MTVLTRLVFKGDEVMAKSSEVKSVRLLEQLQAIDFALVELNLYLDEHPDDIQAINKNEALNEQKQVLRAKLEEQIGAISSYDVLSDPDNWKWSLAPGSSQA
jgi:spore coat protein JB